MPAGLLKHDLRHRAASRSVRSGWISHAIAGVAVSALGLLVAANVPLSSAAETGSASVQRMVALPQSQTASGQIGRGPDQSDPAIAEARAAERAAVASEASLQAFTGRGSGPAVQSSTAVRKAIVRERAAQRTEELLKSAEDVVRTARNESTKVRSDELNTASSETRKAELRIAEQRRERAVQARIAAAVARKQAEVAAAAAAAAAADTTAATDSGDPSSATGGVEPSTQSPEMGNSRLVPARSPAASSASGAGLGAGSASPVPGAVIGARFGQFGLWSRYHTGLDFRAGYGTPIRAVKSGVVLYAGNAGDWAGNHVAVRHGDQMTTMSSHMSSFAVRAGQSVSAGQIIGYVGSTGRAFGAHLHFELYPRGVRYGDVYQAIDPQPWLSANGIRTR